MLNQRLHAVMKLCRSNAAFSTSIGCLKSDKDPHVGRKQNPDVKLIRLSEAFEKLSEPNLAQAQHDFLIGSKQAFLTVTSLLSQGHYDNLHGLVHTHCLELMKKRVESLSKREKDWLKLCDSDVQFTFYYPPFVTYNSASEQLLFSVIFVGKYSQKPTMMQNTFRASLTFERYINDNRDDFLIIFMIFFRFGLVSNEPVMVIP